MIDQADDQHVDIAALMRTAGCKRAEDEGAFDPGQAFDCREDSAANAPGLHGDGLQLAEERARRIRLKADLAAGFLGDQHSGFLEEAQLASDRRGRKAGATRDFPDVEREIRIREKQADHGLPGLAEQGRSQGLGLGGGVLIVSHRLTIVSSSITLSILSRLSRYGQCPIKSNESC